MQAMPRTSRRLDWLLPKWLEDSAAFDQSRDISMGVIAVYFVVNITFGIICILIFSFIRRRKPNIYATKSVTPPALNSTSILGWMWSLFFLEEAEIVDKAGYDVLILTRFYKLCLKIFTSFSIFAFGLILPLNG